MIFRISILGDVFTFQPLIFRGVPKIATRYIFQDITFAGIRINVREGTPNISSFMVVKIQRSKFSCYEGGV